MNCEIYKNQRQSVGRGNKTKAYNFATNTYLLKLNAEIIKEIPFDRAVISISRGTIRRASIDDNNSVKVASRVSLRNCDDSHIGEYVLEKENEDLFYLVKV